MASWEPVDIDQTDCDDKWDDGKFSEMEAKL